MIDREEKNLSVSEQCQLLGVSKSGYYYRPRGITALNLKLMRRIDELHTEHITWGSRKIRDKLREEGNKVNRKRIQRLMRLMDIQVLFPKKNLSKPAPEQTIYPYLLRKMTIDRPNQVWCSDITYIRLSHGFVYLVAIMDWYSRQILSWELSNTPDKHFCMDALRRALRLYGTPEFFNTDQGAQFTSPRFTEILEKASVKISMNGRNRAVDNIVIERFWRTLKYDEVYLKDYESMKEAKESITAYMAVYNSVRPHATHEGKTPEQMYVKNVGNKVA